MIPPLTVKPPVFMNRFMINLKSLSPAGSSQGSSARHWSRFSVPNLRIPDSFLGNIGEDLQHGDEPSENNHDDDHEIDIVSPNIQYSSEAEPEGTSTTPDSSSLCPMAAQVSI